MTNSKGILYVIATPIGNLEDITLRALKTLEAVDCILSEDTRETSKLLRHFNITKQQISYRDQNHDAVFEKILLMLNQGQNLALVSDSGTPLISDPGFKLVRQLKQLNFAIIAIPGPSAVIASLSVSGLPTDKFTFLGFLPKAPNKRKELLKTYGNLDNTLVIYESPFRVKKLLQEVNDTLGNRQVSLINDITKYHEFVITDSLTNFFDTHLSKIKQKGEFVVLISKS